MSGADPNAMSLEPNIEPHLVALHAVAEAAIAAALLVAATGQAAVVARNDHPDEAFEYRAAERSLRAALTAFRSALMDVGLADNGRLNREGVTAGLESVQALVHGSAAMDDWQQEHGPFTAAEVAQARLTVWEMRRRMAGG